MVSSFYFYAMPGTGVALECMLLWRLWRQRLLKNFPYFAAFVFYDVLRTATFVTVFHFKRGWYAPTYWDTEAVALALLFAIVWEVARHLFPVGSTTRQLAWKIVAMIEAVLLPALLFLAWGWSQADFHHYAVLRAWPVVEQYFTVAVSLLLLVISGVARYYGVSFGRNMRGLIGGFGVYLCLYAANFAALQVVSQFHLFWQVLSSLTYSAMIAFWLWAFWKYSPVPAQPSRELDYARSKKRWGYLWAETTSALRRGQN